MAEEKGIKEVAADVGPRALSGQLTLPELAAGKAALGTYEKALDLLGIKAGIVTQNIKGLAGSIQNLNQISELETKTLKALSSAFSLDFGGALNQITKELAGSAGKAQLFQQELLRLGQTTQFQEVARGQASELMKLGISYTDLKKDTTDLIKNFDASVRITDEQSKSFDVNSQALVRLTAFNQKLGVDSKKTADILNYTKDVMGGGTAAAIKLSDQLDKFARKTGQSTADVFNKFNESMNRFAVVSADKAVQGFEKLELYAKRTGQPIKDIITTLEKFDDIDKGFEAGGQLNRVLSFMGGSFDTFRAMQADDEERAKMIYQSIAGVADQFQTLQSDQAKRAFAKQLVDSTGMEMKTVVGLLNKSTDLSKDIMDISKAPMVKEGYTDEERTARIVSMTTSDEFRTARDGLIEASKAATQLADSMRIGERGRTEQSVDLYRAFDEKFLAPIVSGNQEKLAKMVSDFKSAAAKELKEALSGPADTFNKAINVFAGLVNEGKIATATAGYSSVSSQSSRGHYGQTAADAAHK